MTGITVEGPVEGAVGRLLLCSLSELSDLDLYELGDAVRVEQMQRLLASGDPEAVAGNAFVEGFDGRGRVRSPWMEKGFVVCPGVILPKSAQSHDCSFVSVGGVWVWESELRLHHERRSWPDRDKEHSRFVSLLAGEEGLEFDVVHMRMRMSVHSLVRASSYRVEGGTVQAVATRTVSTSIRH